MRESLRRRLRLPPLHPPPPPSPPPPPPKSQHHPPIDDDLEEGELKDVDSHHLIKRKYEPDEEVEGRIVQSIHVKEIESDERGVVADEPECPVDEQKSEQFEQKHQGEDKEERPESEPVLEDNVVNAAAVMDDDGNQGVLESEVEEREKQSGELEDRVQGGEDVMERNETEKGGGEMVEKVSMDEVANLAVPEGEEQDKNNQEEREISTEQHPGGGEKVENDFVIEAVEETGQLDMPVEEETQNLMDNQDEATALPAGENVGKTDDEQVGQPDLAMEEVEKVTEKDDVDDEEEDGPPPGWESGPPVNPLPPLPPPPPPPPPEKGQLVCGSCRRLLSYPRGFKHVQCSCCQTVNYVLEEHQVGQVQCGNCLLLLMYPFGAPSVRCCSCRFVTDIGNRNKRLRLSEQQSRACRPFCVPL